MSEFPQETCPMGEHGECAYRSEGIGLGCQTCGRYVHPGDKDWRKLYDFHANAPGFEDMRLNKAGAEGVAAQEATGS